MLRDSGGAPDCSELVEPCLLNHFFKVERHCCSGGNLVRRVMMNRTSAGLRSSISKILRGIRLQIVYQSGGRRLRQESSESEASTLRKKLPNLRIVRSPKLQFHAHPALP